MTHNHNRETAKRLLLAVAAANTGPDAVAVLTAALDQAERRGDCPGERQCYARGGTQPCRSHGCRACGAPILADTEGWPAPLCVVHAPEPLLDYVSELRRLLEQLVESTDGLHAADCRSRNAAGRAVSDFELDTHVARSPAFSCSCGAKAVRDSVRLALNLPRRVPHGVPS